MANRSSDVFDLPKESKPTWQENGGYLFITTIRNFFRYSSESPKARNNLNLEEIASTLLAAIPDNTGQSENKLSKDLLEKSSELLRQQRQLENTRARKRLESWATKLITYYLLSVSFILIANAFAKVYFHLDISPISDKVMIVILSTPTINIIGLGIIVLKGHFDKEH
ncbi:MAG: hypothetical protein ACLS29_08850 [Prevotellamassilia sp.]